MDLQIEVKDGRVMGAKRRTFVSRRDQWNGIKVGAYIPLTTSPEDAMLWDAARNTDVKEWTDGEHECDAWGPGLEGNPKGLITRVCTLKAQKIHTPAELSATT